MIPTPLPLNFRKSSLQKWPYPPPPSPPLKHYVIIAWPHTWAINLLQLLCSYGIYLPVWCLAAALCGICLREWYLNTKLGGIHLYRTCKKKKERKKKKIIINLRKFLQIFLLVIEPSSKTNKRCLYFIGTFS